MNKRDYYGEEFKTPKFIAAYPEIIEPVPAYGARGKDGVLEYSITMLFPKATANMAPISEAIKKLALKIFGKDGKVDMRYLDLPVYDGDEPNRKGVVVEAFKGHWIMRAKSTYPIAVFNADRTPIRDKALVSSGNIMQAVIQPHAYDKENNGIHMYLLSVYKHSDGEPLKLGSGTKITADIWEDEANAVMSSVNEVKGVSGLF